MRRALSIFLALLFGLGPLAATLPGSDDARLPSCCRRNGAHHCDMSDATLARMMEAALGQVILSAPAHCPMYPGNVHALLPPGHAITSAEAADLPALMQARLLVVAGAAPLAGQIPSGISRGPPAVLPS
jgi:hypothetical protein